MFQFNKANKYRNVPIVIDGITFQSKKEGNLYLELSDMLRRLEIVSLERQVAFELIPSQYETVVDGKKTKQIVAERSCVYIADFVIKYPDGEIVVIDAKGMRLSDYKIKRKLMRWIHKIKIKEV